MIVGKLMVVLGLDSTGFNTGINSATGKTTLFAKATDKTFKAIKKAAKIGMIAVSAAFIKGAIDAGKFEKALANVATMLDKTTMPIMKDFKKGILDMSEAYGESTDALAKGLYDILSASIPAAKALDVLEVSAQAAKAGLTDTGVAADAITTLMNSFNDATKDAGYYSDILFSTVKFGKTTFSELAPVIGNVAKMMEVAGGTAEDMAGMLAIMTRNGIKTRIAVTSLRGVVSALIKPSEALTKELGGMTVKADGFRAVMDKIGSLPATDLAEMFPNIRALSGVVVAAKDLGAEVEKINELMERGSPTRTAFAIQSDTLAFIWDKLKATLKATSITIGDELLPILKEIFTSMTSWLKDNREEFADFARTTLEGIKTIVNTIFNLKEVILGLGGAILGVMIIQKVTTLMKSFGIATSVSMGPVAAIAVAIGLLVGVFFKLRKELRDQREEEQLLNDAQKGRLGTIEEYNDAIEIQRNKISDLTEERAKATDETKIMSLADAEYARAADIRLTKEIEDGKIRLSAIRDFALEKERAGRIERAEAEATAAIERQLYLDELQRISESEMAESEKAEKKRQLDFEEEQRLKDIADEKERIAERAVQVEADKAQRIINENLKLDEVLWQASASESDRIERRRGELEILGRSYEDITKILAIEFPKAAEEGFKETSDNSDTFWNNMTGKPVAFTEAVTEAALTFEEKFTEAVTKVQEVFSLVFSSLTGTVNQYFANMFSKLENEEATKKKITSAERKRVEKLYADELISEEEYQKQIDIIDAQELADEKVIAQKRYDIELKQFKVTKALNIAEALMNTATAVTAALDLFFPLNLAIAALVGGLGAAQVGLIAGQTAPAAPAFIKGGVVDKMIAGGLFAGKPGIDTNNIAVTSGEYIMPPQQTIDNMDELESMRSGGGGGKNIVVTPMPLNIEMEGRNIFSGMVEFMTDESDLGSFRINPKVLGVTT